MQAAKKLMLVDPQFLEQLKVDKEYKQIQKPVDSVVRTNLSLDIGKTLSDDSLTEDQKVKRYLQTLNRYLQVTDEVSKPSTSKSNPLTEPRVKKRVNVCSGCHTKMSYEDVRASGSFGGIGNVRRYGGKVNELPKMDAYTLHKTARVRFPRRRRIRKA